MVGRSRYVAPRMSCPSCGHVNPSGNAFCGGCGAKLVDRCPSCGQRNLPDDAFCGSCGARLRTASSSESRGERRRATAADGDVLRSGRLHRALGAARRRGLPRAGRVATARRRPRRSRGSVGTSRATRGTGSWSTSGGRRRSMTLPNVRCARAWRSSSACDGSPRPIRSPCASASTRVRSWWRTSMARWTCSGKPRTWPRACRRWRRPTPSSSLPRRSVS